MTFVDSINRRIPDLFAEIITADRNRKSYCGSPVPSIQMYRQMLGRRRELSNAADKFCQRQKGAPAV